MLMQGEVEGPPKPALPFQSHKQTLLRSEILSEGFQASRGNPAPQLSRCPQLQRERSSGALGGLAASSLPAGGQSKVVEPPLSLQTVNARWKQFHSVNASSFADFLNDFVDTSSPLVTLESGGAVTNPCFISRMTDSPPALEGSYGSEGGRDHPRGHQQQKPCSQSPFLSREPLAEAV